jgi:aryl-alcohol dehydrogenase-like predicted oxidoreductase
MQYTHLGRTGLTVSRLCLGTMNFGREADEAASQAILDRALELGINFVDTANVYSTALGEGQSEQIIGRWLAGRPGARDQIVLATKVHNPMGAGPNDRGLSAYHIRRACEESLRRLHTDHIDLYQMHHVDRTTPWSEIWQAMEQLVREGKILYAGSSNFAAWHIAQANEQAAARHFLGLVSEQSRYSLRDRMIELEVLPACRAYGVGVIPWGPLAGGLLAGTADQADGGRRQGEWMQGERQKYGSQLTTYAAFCQEVGAEQADVALAWLLHQPGVTGPIIGPRTVAQLESSLRALDIALPADALARLDQIWPGPGGAAPEAYAW